MFKIFQKVRHYYSALGPAGTIAFIYAKASGTRPVFKTRLAGIRHPVYVRIGTTDISVLRQVLIEKHYDLPCQIAPKFILDAGANIGLSAVFFANKYPDATIIAVEPEASNFRLLQKNVSLYPQIRPLQAALWKENKQINLVDPSNGHHGFQTVEKNANGGDQSGLVQALTVDAIISRMGLKTFDFLKIDIEGAEKEVFEHSSPWIGQVSTIMVELHDHLKAGCSQSFGNATQDFSESGSRGETIVRFRKAVANQRRDGF